MRPTTAAVHSQITFFYYPDLDAAAHFYSDIMGFELVDDQRWAKLYRVRGDAFMGIVAGENGFRQPQAYNAVLLTVCVNDVATWYDYLKAKGVKMLTDVLEKEDIQVRCFFFEDPGGYPLEVQQFLRADMMEIFHRDG